MSTFTLSRPGTAPRAAFGQIAEQHVGRFDVAVHQPGRVCRGQGRGHLGDHVHRGSWIQRAAVEDPGQRRPVHQFQHQVGHPRRAGLTVVVDLRDARVGQRPGVPRLGAEPGQCLRMARVPLLEKFHCHEAVQHLVPGPPYLTHGAGGDPAFQPVTAREEHSRERHRAHTLPASPAGGRAADGPGQAEVTASSASALASASRPSGVSDWST